MISEGMVISAVITELSTNAAAHANAFYLRFLKNIIDYLIPKK